MDCTRFEDLLFAGLDGEVAERDRELMERHVRDCPRCRQIAALVRGNEESTTAELPDDFAAAVLSSTSGSPCDRAQLLLARADEGLPHDGDLLALHLGTCPDCAAMARALVQLRHELPALAEVDPGERFIAGVMAATVGVREPVRAPLWARSRELWERLMQRPRLALEGAYAAAMLLVLVFGLPSASLADLPARAFDTVRQEGAKVERAVSGRIDDIAELGQIAWAESTARAATFLERSEESRSDEAVGRLRAWAGAVQRFAQGVWETLFAPVFEDLQSLWNENASGAVEPDATEQANP